MYNYKVERKPQTYGVTLNSIPCSILYKCCLNKNRITASKCIREENRSQLKRQVGFAADIASLLPTEEIFLLLHSFQLLLAALTFDFAHNLTVSFSLGHLQKC